MRKFTIGVAAAALAASGALAAPGNGHGDGHERGPQQHDQHGSAAPKSDHKPGPPAAQAAPKPDHRGPGAAADHDTDRRPAAGHPPAPAARAPVAHEEHDRRAEDRRIDQDRRAAAQQRERIVREREADRRRVVERDVRRVADRRIDNDRIYRLYRYNRGPLDGCPPGLQQKHNGCLPPGQAKKLDPRRLAWSRPAYYGYDGWGDGRYLYDDGYLLRLGDGGGVASYVPLLGGALSIGNPWPSYYEPVPVSNYYVDYYNLGPQGGYRYADNVLYRVNPQDSAITSIAALLTGDQFTIGQPMPSGYDVYNVPYAYRDRYQDTPDSWYRYSDGYVYQVDPTTRLVQAAIELLI